MTSAGGWLTRNRTKAGLKLGLLAALSGLMLLPATVAKVSWLPGYVARVQASGKAASLPPHLSMVLGLGDGTHELAVQQAGKRSGEEVHTFNVAQSEAGSVVVLMDHNEATSLVRAFRLKPGGDLDKAVTYQAGAQPQPIPDAPARKALRAELDFWGAEAAAQ